MSAFDKIIWLIGIIALIAVGFGLWMEVLDARTRRRWWIEKVDHKLDKLDDLDTRIEILERRNG